MWSSHPAILLTTRLTDTTTRRGHRAAPHNPRLHIRLVLSGQPQHQRPHLAMGCRAPGAAPARQPRPPAADDVAVPAQYRAGSDDQPRRRQALRWHRPREQCQPCAVRPRRTRMSARPLALSHSELMAQHQDLGVLPPPLPPRQAQQRHGTGDNQEDQLYAHKPKIIPRPHWQALGHATSGQRCMWPGDTSFRHPQVGVGFAELRVAAGDLQKPLNRRFDPVPASSSTAGRRPSGRADGTDVAAEPSRSRFPAAECARLCGVAQLEGVGGDVDVELQAEHSREPGQGG